MVPFISDDDLSAYLGTTVSETDLNTVIALDSACQAVRDYLRRDINLVEDDIVTLDGTGTSVLLLPERPVVDIAEIQVDDEVIDADEYVWDADTGRVIRLQDTWWWTPWGDGVQNIQVTYSHGWALSEADVSGLIERVPSSIRLVALRLAAATYRGTIAASASGSGSIKTETIGSYSYTLDDGAAQARASQALTDDDRRTLRTWQDLRVA